MYMYVLEKVNRGTGIMFPYTCPLKDQGPSIKDVRIFFGGGGSQTPMLQDIQKQKLGKSGSKSRHGGGGYQKWPKNSDVFYGRPLF